MMHASAQNIPCASKMKIEIKLNEIVLDKPIKRQWHKAVMMLWAMHGSQMKRWTKKRSAAVSIDFMKCAYAYHHLFTLAISVR